VSWSARAERLTRYRASEILGQHCSRLYAASDTAQGKPERDLRAASTAGRFEEAGARVRKDGSAFRAHVVTKPLRDTDGTLRGFRSVLREIGAREPEATGAAPAGPEASPAPGESPAPPEPAARKSPAHELRNRLATVANAVFYLKLILPGDREEGEYVRLLEREVRQIMKILPDVPLPEGK
jgi:PAS domain S-box-containing protein